MGKKDWMNMAHIGSKKQLAELEGCCSGVVQHTAALNTELYYKQLFLLQHHVGTHGLHYLATKTGSTKIISAATNHQ